MVAENAGLFEGVVSEGKTAVFHFHLPYLLTVDGFLDELIASFADPFAAQKALKSLQDFAMGRLGVQQYNVKFNSLLYCVKGLSEPILMDYYQRGLSDCVRRQAMGRPDWGPCRSTKALQAVTLLASKHLDDLSTVHRPVFPGGAPPPTANMISVPRDPAAMDLDVHAAVT